MSDWFTIVLLGIIEGLTEFIPVSSTGHLLIAEHWLPRQSDLFNVVIQCGAVIAVLPLFPERMTQLFNCWRDFKARDFVLKVLVAFGITGVGGFILEKKNFKLPEKVLPVALALVIGGVLFIVVEQWLKGRETRRDITWNVAIAVGFGQLLAAIFPGTSRSGATILLMLAFGLARPTATEFSFLVGVPTMLAAGGYKIFKALHNPPPGTIPENWTLLLASSVVAAVVSFLAVKWMLRFIQTHTFVGFGWYRVAAGAGLLILFWT